MLVKALVEQYLNATDNDLRYMVLRQDLTICEPVQDADLLVKKILLPVLLEETDPEIVELVSSQVYPQMTLKCIEKMNEAGTVLESQWFDGLIIEPLFEQIESKRTSFIVQTIRNVFKVVEGDGKKVASSTERYMRRLIAQMKGKKGERRNTVLYWDTLDLMISAYYDSVTRMSFEVLSDIFDMYEDRSDNTTNAALINSIKAATSSAVTKLLEREISDGLLETISSVWWQFHSVASRLFEHRLIPSLHAKASEPLMLALQTIWNFRPFYQVPSVEHSRPTLSDKAMAELQSAVAGLLNRASASDSNKEAPSSMQQELIIEDTEIDDEQQAYLDQLQADDDLQFDELDDDPSTSADEYNYEQITEKCSAILKSLHSDPPEPCSHGNLLPSLDDVKVSALSTEKDIQDVSRTAWAVLETETALPALLLSVDVLGQILQNNLAEIDCSRTCESLLLHMKQNKSFLQTIKVGNMTQTIDEGSTFRTMVYSTMLQIVTTRSVDYPVCCKVLIEALSRGVRDSDCTINQLSIRIIEALLQANYEAIRGIDPEWYNLTLLPRVAEIATKVSKKLQSRSEGRQDRAQHPAATAETVIDIVDRLHCLFDRQYPAIA
ncbi:hypothetical protein HG536_0F02460 [Torulaspora globosa]|uniref:TATA-binding protein interacting (TIP20) domain-containing protein n=1 Tax=Torulaspora globosa TaxID=48254 RepID=A0A7G3ZK85_9SACH|nr:uncharacterized protein HG536_0F02460 [Torulaspora globosa]QLL33921.1 hypothetical protein HG536_0F02460 [Torulaspora globosa]